MEFNPDLIICSEVSAIIPSYKYKKSDNNKCKIVSDITEWYPENVAFKKKSIMKYLTYLILFLGNIFLVNLCNQIIIGEKAKLKRYIFLAPLKSKIIIGYYPVLNFFKFYPCKVNINEFTLCYAGLINFDRGILTLLFVASKLAEKHNGLIIRLKIIGRFEYPDEESKFKEILKNISNISVERVSWTDYDKISENLIDVHLCFDLRRRNFIYRNSLPIKIFEYMACGKPFISSNIKPIREELKNYHSLGTLVNSDNQNEIINAIEKYINDPDLLLKHSKNCRNEIENKKNWEEESVKLITLIRYLI